jgi:hypothetical protein
LFGTLLQRVPSLLSTTQLFTQGARGDIHY